MDKQPINKPKPTTDKVVLDFLNSIKNNSFMEFMLYIPAIVLVTIVAIVIKPTKLTLLIATILSLSYISILLSHAECKTLSSNDNIFFIIITFCFTFVCILFYYGVNIIYWNYPKYYSLLLLTPILYFSLIKVIFYSFDCNQYTNYNFLIDLLILVNKFVFKIININLY